MFSFSRNRYPSILFVFKGQLVNFELLGKTLLKDMKNCTYKEILRVSV